MCIRPRLSLFGLLLLLGGCQAPWMAPVGGFAAGNAASVVVFGRSIPDLAVSALSGKNCSIVRLDQGKSYCQATQPPPDQPPFCSRSLGVVDCWKNPEDLPDHPQSVADGPWRLTPAQERNRVAPWPKALTADD